ncbi:MAG: DsbA family protein [Vulcanisaeta sp.]|nr:DsbA family protein [Vulcanisaeta sp.]
MSKTPTSTSINKALLVTVIVLAVALVAVLVYFLMLKPSETPGKQTQALTPALAFERGVENWLGIECVYGRYGGNATLDLINNIYAIAYRYVIEYTQSGNVTYLLEYPVAQYEYLVSKYPKCALNGADQYLANVVVNALNNVSNVAVKLGIPNNLLGTPLFIVFNRANNVTYVLAGASPLVFSAINYAETGNTTVFTYQSQVLGYGFRANSTQVNVVNSIISSGLRIGNPGASVVVIEYLDPECPYCALFQVEYGSALDSMVINGSVLYVIHYFPTHVLSYGCSSPTIAPLLGPYCG